MAASAENRQRPITGVRPEYEPDEPRVTLDRTGMNQGSNGSTVYYVLAALVVLAIGYYVYSSYGSPGVVTPTTTQSTPAPVEPAPKVEMSTPDAPADQAPLAPSATPPAQAPADNSATPPADQKTP